MLKQPLDFENTTEFHCDENVNKLNPFCDECLNCSKGGRLCTYCEPRVYFEIN